MLKTRSSRTKIRFLPAGRRPCRPSASRQVTMVGGYLFFGSAVNTTTICGEVDEEEIIIKIINKGNTTKKNIAYGNYLLARYERQNKNFEQEMNFLIKGHLNYFESQKDKYKKEIHYWLYVLPKIKKFNKKK